MANHAILSPSGFKALMLCPAKPAMERGLPDQSSGYADEGTLAHELAAALLTDSVLPSGCDDEMLDYVAQYVQTVRDYQGQHDLFVEQPLPIGHITGEDGAEGTGDAVILRNDEIIIIDLKYGRGIEVDAEMNPQLMLYGLGALEKFGLLGDFKRVRMVICQPRVSSAPSEFDMSVESLVEWGMTVAGPAADLASVILQSGNPAYIETHCNPHPEACRFCKAKPTCPSLAASVSTAIGAEFTDLTTESQVEQEVIVKQLTGGLSVEELGAKMDSVELIEMWCKAIRARVESQLLDGKSVAGYKLVAGKKGNRAWRDAVQAEAALKAMRLKKDEMYDLKLISPTSAEKLLKAQPKRWSKVAPLITQADGKPSVAPVSDKRPALEIQIESEFAVIEGAEDLV